MHENILRFPEPITEPGARLPRFTLPLPPTELFGRERTIEVCALLLGRPEVRLLTLTGSGGVGKTRLALALSRLLQETFRDGVCVVSLSATHDPRQVMPTLALALGLQTGHRPLFEVVQTALRHAHLLLVFDNFEQVLPAAPHLPDLLSICPDVRMLVTSRAALRVDGEHEFPVPPLALPDLIHGNAPEKLAASPAVALFVERARMHLPTFHLDAANAVSIAQICIALQGVPLALELAAARIKLLPPQALLARLAHPLQVLTAGSRSAPVRQQTLRQTIQWSYDLLAPEEQRLFRRMSVFRGGWTLPAAEAITSALQDDPAQVLERMAALLDQSLLQPPDAEDVAEPRFQMLETIREFGLECLISSGELEQVAQAHVQYYLTWAETNRQALFGNDQSRLIGDYVQEQWNWRAVMSFVLMHHETAAALRLAGGLSIFWLVWGYSFDQLYLVEGRAFLEQVLLKASLETTRARAWALSVYGGILALLRELEPGLVACKQGLALARKEGSSEYIITSLWMLLLPLITRDDLQAAQIVAAEAVALARTQREAGSEWGVAWLLGYSLHRAGYVALWQGRYQEARAYLTESLALCGQVGELYFTLWSTLLLGEADALAGDAEEARERIESILPLYQSLDIRTQVAEALGFLGWLSLRAGDVEQACAQLAENLRLRNAVGEAQGIAWAEIWLAQAERTRQNDHLARQLLDAGLARAIGAHSRLYTTMGLEELALLVAEQGEATWAPLLLGQAEVLREAMGAPLPPVERGAHDDCIVTLRSALGDARYAELWAQGRSMTPRQVLADPSATASSATALSASAPKALLPPEAAAIGLTRRELEVLRLLAQGQTPTQIAHYLVIGLVTVNAHIRSIYRKLGVTSRGAATHYAFEHHLL